MTTSVYLDPETKQKIRDIKEENPEFNLSSFIRSCLFEKYDKNKDSIADLVDEKEKLSYEITKKQHEIEKIDEKIAEIKVVRKQEEVQKREILTKEEKTIEDRKKAFYNFAVDVYDIPEEDVERLAKEFSYSNLDLRTYCKEKRFVLREVKE